MGDVAYPASPTGQDLRQNRKELLARYHDNKRPCRGSLFSGVDG